MTPFRLDRNIWHGAQCRPEESSRTRSFFTARYCAVSCRHLYMNPRALWSRRYGATACDPNYFFLMYVFSTDRKVFLDGASHVSEPSQHDAQRLSLLGVPDWRGWRSIGTLGFWFLIGPLAGERYRVFCVSWHNHDDRYADWRASTSGYSQGMYYETYRYFITLYYICTFTYFIHIFKMAVNNFK